jgi:hypothetical protein
MAGIQKRDPLMRCHLRTLMIVLVLWPVALALAYFVWRAMQPEILERRTVAAPGSVRIDSEGNVYDGEGRMVKAQDKPPPDNRP